MQKEGSDMSLQFYMLLHAQLLNVQELPSIQASNKILAWKSAVSSSTYSVFEVQGLWHCST
jgi:hypothetical protein